MSGHGTVPGYEDVLDTGTPGRVRLWSGVAVVAVLALIGWTLRSSPPGPEAAPIAAVTTPQVAPTVPDRKPEAADRVGEFAFADDRSGYLVQYRCSEVRPDGSCPRRLFATDDGGRTWDSRGFLPTYADSFSPVLVVSERELVLIDSAAVASLARSIDGGRNWVRLPVSRGAPAPAPPGSTVIQEFPQACYATACPPTAVWIDVDSQTLHPLPVQPPSGAGAFLRAVSTSTDGELVASTATVTTARISMSSDGGRRWTEVVLDVPLDTGDVLLDVRAKPAGNGRAYAFVQVQVGVRDGTGIDVMHGFRTDDAGATWTGLGWEPTSVNWFPQAVVAGELITTDAAGRVLLSSGGGTTWRPVYGAPTNSWIRQIVPDGPILLTAFDDSGGESHHLSLHGRAWTLLRLLD
ncbi:MAG: hypothetical protein H0V67_03345 [Geodermatophilaceae bacterium]|nr:hypothetical protein [Geodermatophilaceae bacterium]